MVLYPFESPIANAKRTYTATSLVFCRLGINDGVEVIRWAHGVKVVYETLCELERYTVGRDPYRYGSIWAGMYLPKVFGRKGLTARAISFWDIALRELIGKHSGQPLYKLLGGYADGVPVYMADGYCEDGKGLDDLAAEVAGWLITPIGPTRRFSLIWLSNLSMCSGSKNPYPPMTCMGAPEFDSFAM